MTACASKKLCVVLWWRCCTNEVCKQHKYLCCPNVFLHNPVACICTKLSVVESVVFGTCKGDSQSEVLLKGKVKLCLVISPCLLLVPVTGVLANCMCAHINSSVAQIDERENNVI